MNEENGRKLWMVLISFGISVAFFLILRVFGVVYFVEDLEEIADVNVFSLFNLVTWVGFLVFIGISALVLNYTLVTDKSKLAADLLFATVLIIVIVSLIGFNYIGVKYPYIYEPFGNTFSGYLNKFFRFPNWVSLFALDFFSEPFWFWLTFAIIYHLILVTFLLVDIPDILNERQKKEPKINKINKELLVVGILIIVTVLIVFYIFVI